MMHGLAKVKFKVFIIGMYPRMPWELVADPLGSAEQTLGRAALQLEIILKFTLFLARGNKVSVIIRTTRLKSFNVKIVQNIQIHYYQNVRMLKVQASAIHLYHCT